MALTLIIGNKNYSTWSLRPWIAMTRRPAFPSRRRVIPFEQRRLQTRSRRRCPGTGKVPVLIDGDIKVWESLAILEYLTEKFPEAGLWPADIAARAHARVVANEMHAGFQALRNHMPMNFARRVMKRDLTPPVVGRRAAHRGDLWADCRARFGKGGAFPVRRVLRGRRDVCAGGVAAFRPTMSMSAPQTRAYMDGDHGAAGLAAMDRSRYQGALAVRRKTKSIGRNP